MIKFTQAMTTFITDYALDEYINAEFGSLLDSQFETGREIEANSDTYLLYTIKKGEEVEDIHCHYTNKVYAFLQMMVEAGTIPEGKIVVDCTW